MTTLPEDTEHNEAMCDFKTTVLQTDCQNRGSNDKPGVSLR